MKSRAFGPPTTGRSAGNAFGGASSQSTLSFATPPPDLSAISDPNLVVSFKNLLKKSDATLVKGLEDIRTFVLSKNDGPEDAVIKAWSELYPRLAINNSRRVRELSHAVQLAILGSARASIQPYIAQMVPTWFAGTFDNDKAVAKAATAGWESLLNTKEKKLALLKKSQAVILAYAQEGLDETPETLSDDRTMSPDDLKATYTRLIGNCVDMVNHLMSSLNEDDRKKYSSKYETFFSSPNFLECTFSDDAHLRRSSIRLIHAFAFRNSPIIEANLKAVRHALLFEALDSNQLGSASDLLELIKILTARFPDLWTTQAKSRKSPLACLRNFVEKGSQRGEPSYWSCLASLFATLPDDILPPDTVTLLDVLSSIRIGIKNRDEPKRNLASAWGAYINISRDMIVKRLFDPEAQVKVAQGTLLPLIANFTLMDPSSKAATVANEPATVEAVLQLFASLESGPLRDRSRELIAEVLVQSAKKLEADLFSQVTDDNIVSRFSHWFQIVDWGFAGSELKAYLGSAVFEEENILSITGKLVQACRKAIERRQGKSYGAASGLLACMISTAIAKESPALLDFVKTYIEKSLFRLLLTPSGEYLLSALDALKVSGQQDSFNQIWSTTIRKVLESDANDQQVRSIQLMLLKGNSSNLALENSLLQTFITYHVKLALEKEMGEDTEPSWKVLSAAASSDSISETTFTEITDTTIATLLQGSDAAIDRGLRALNCFSEKDHTFKLYSDDERVKLLTCLIRLSEDEMDSNDPREEAIRSLTRVVANSNESGLAVSLIGVLQKQMTNLEQSALSIHALGILARRILAAVDDQHESSTLQAIFPTTEQFEQICTFYQDAPHSSIGACEPFGSALFLVDSSSAFREKMVPDTPYDSNGHSVPLRVALYLCELMQSTMLYMTDENVAEDLKFLCIVSEHVRSQRVSRSPKGLYNMSCAHLEIFQGQLHSLIWQVADNSTSWRRNSKGDVPAHDTTSILDILVEKLLKQSRGRTFLAFYSGLALSRVLSVIVDSRGPNFECTESRLEEMKVVAFSKEFDAPFASLAVLNGFGQVLQSSESVKKFCKTLIGMFRDFGMETLGKDSLHRAYLNVCLLNGCLAVYGEDAIPSNTPQLVHAVMKMISWVDSEDFSDNRFAVASEICRALTKILPVLSQSNGTFWVAALEKLCLAPWDMHGLSVTPSAEHSHKAPVESQVFVLCSWSVKLYARLARLKVIDEEDAFSLRDAFEDDDMQTKLNNGLLGLLEHRRDEAVVITPYDRPVFAAFYECLRPEISKIPIESIDLEGMYPLINFPILATQAIAFETIGRALPKIIEDLTLKVALDKEDAELPAELQSLLLSDVLETRPTSSDGEFHISLDRTLFAQRSVLLAWNLVIQSFGLAPYQVKMGFIKTMQQLGVLHRLCEFVNLTFSVPDGKMKLLSLDKEILRSYDVQDMSHPDGLVHNVRWLTAVNYFLALKYMPHLVKGWYLEFTRAGKAAIQAWTQTYFTPIVLEDTIKEIRQWRETEESKEAMTEFEIKLPSKSGNTMTLSYQVDDQYCVVQFVFPDCYPLESISVKSVNRVGVPERTWVSVINSISGAMRFNGGSVIDGIEVFKRNVSGFIEGHEACCICYSIISEDMKVPDKKCGTCKNNFHGKCLAQWFNTSNANTCPMCRQPMTGLGRR